MNSHTFCGVALQNPSVQPLTAVLDMSYSQRVKVGIKEVTNQRNTLPGNMLLGMGTLCLGREGTRCLGPSIRRVGQAQEGGITV